MKKLLLTVLVGMFFVGVSFAVGDIKVKAGMDLLGGLSTGGSAYYDDVTDIGFSLGAEYLHPVSSIFQVGGGFQYLLPRGSNDFSYLPLYVTFQANPINSAQAVFFKANLGYSVVADVDTQFDAKGGVYLGFGAGYEFSSGWFVEGVYDIYRSKLEGKTYRSKFQDQILGNSFSENLIYSKFGINGGYRFKI